jgi:hypothetical protein
MTTLTQGTGLNRRVVHLSRQPWNGSDSLRTLCGHQMRHPPTDAGARSCDRCVDVLTAQNRRVDNGGATA